MTVEMDESEIDALLVEEGSGVLALTDGAETYAVPESFGYDGDRLYFQFVSREDSEKLAFVESTAVASFVVYTEQPARSVLVRGHIDRVPDDEQPLAAAAIADNADIPTLNIYPDADLDDLEMAFYRLVPAELSGRRFDTDAT